MYKRVRQLEKRIEDLEAAHNANVEVLKSIVKTLDNISKGLNDENFTHKDSGNLEEVSIQSEETGTNESDSGHGSA